MFSLPFRCNVTIRINVMAFWHFFSSRIERYSTDREREIERRKKTIERRVMSLRNAHIDSSVSNCLFV